MSAAALLLGDRSTSEVPNHDDEDDDVHIESSVYNICFLFHSADTDDSSLKMWEEVLTERFPSWTLHTMTNYNGKLGLCGDSVEWVSIETGEEVVTAIRNLRDSDTSGANPRIIMHCIGHEMGGILIRSILVELAETLGQDMPELGHYMSIGTPHLGLQSSWLSPFNSQRNLWALAFCWGASMVQLTIQDRRIPFLVKIGTGRYLELLSRFRVRTCVGLATGDRATVSSATIDHGNVEARRRFTEKTFWCFDRRDDLEPESSFARQIEEDSKKDFFFPAPKEGPREGDVGALETLLRVLTILLGWLGVLWFLIFMPIVYLRMLCKRQRSPGSYVLDAAAAAEAERKDISKQASLFSGGKSMSGLGETSTGTTDYITQQTSMPHLGAGKSFNIAATKTEKASREGGIVWETSADGCNICPDILYKGLRLLPWQRITVNFHNGFTRSSHPYFMIGSVKHQPPDDNDLSKQCIQCLAEILAD